MLSGIDIMKVSYKQTVKSTDVCSPDMQGAGGLDHRQVTCQHKNLHG